MNRNLTRRRFVRAAAAAAAGPLVLPARVLGRGGGVAPSERLLLGCVGMGGQGQVNMRNLMSQPEVQLVALCDVEQGLGGKGLSAALAAARAHAEKIGRPLSEHDVAVYRDFRELLARPDVDIVSIATPDHWHGVIAAAAARAGKDIYYEKPLTNSIPEGRAVCEAVARHGRVL